MIKKIVMSIMLSCMFLSLSASQELSILQSLGRSVEPYIPTKQSIKELSASAKDYAPELGSVLLVGVAANAMNQNSSEQDAVVRAAGYSLFTAVKLRKYHMPHDIKCCLLAATSSELIHYGTDQEDPSLLATVERIAFATTATLITLKLHKIARSLFPEWYHINEKKD